MGTPTALRKERSVLTGTSFANNTTGAITAQMVRQFTESGMGGYGTIYSPAGTPASQAVASGATATIDWNADSVGADGPDDTGSVSSTTVGADADLVVWNPRAEGHISASTHFHRCDSNIFEGFKTMGAPTWVVANGDVQFEEGNLKVERGAGRYIFRQKGGFPAPC